MLTRVYINNYRCLVDFEFLPGRRQLIMGPNGSGKSSLLDALQLLRRLVVLQHEIERHKILNQRTLWLNLPNLRFEIEASIDGAIYAYHLEIEPAGDPETAQVHTENVKFNGKPIFEFYEGRVHLYDDQSHRKVDYPFGRYRSALAMAETKENRKLIRFKEWFSHLLCFRINPFKMDSRSESEDRYPWRDLSNFSAWYRHLRLSNHGDDGLLHNSLQEALDGFRSLQFEDFGEGTRLLLAEFVREDGRNIRLRFNQLSDGQRCLIGLYTILYFVVAKGYTVIIDEPDNFLALREIQPWLNEISATMDDGHGQVLIISHHPELLDQWAPSYGVRFVRDGMSQVQVKEFTAEAYSMLRPSEVVARGWENE